MYWEQDQEITLLWSILEPLDPEEDAGIADEIVCSLIEMELVDMTKAPYAQQAWQDTTEGRGVTREFVAEFYKDAEDVDE